MISLKSRAQHKTNTREKRERERERRLKNITYISEILPEVECQYSYGWNCQQKIKEREGVIIIYNTQKKRHKNGRTLGMHGVYLSLDAREVRPLAGVLVPRVLHDPVDIVGTAIRCIHSVALFHVLGHIFYWLQRERKRSSDMI